MKSYKIQLPVFLLFCISFYISRYRFYNFLEFHSTLSEKDYYPKFSFFNGFSPLPQHHPPNSQNLQNVTSFLTIFPKMLSETFFFNFLLTKFCKAFFKGSNYRFSGLLFRTYFKNSYFDTHQ